VTALRIHLRTSPLRWCVLPLTVLALVVLLPQSRNWIGHWTATGAATQVCAFFLSVVTAGAAAWVSSSDTSRIEEQTAAAAVPTVWVEGARWGATTALLLVPYLVGVATGFALTARTFPDGVDLWLGYVLMGLNVMLFAVMWGWTIGRYFSRTYAALVASLSWFVFEAFPGAVAGLGVPNGPAWKQPNAQALLLRLAFLAVFVAVVVWLPRRPSRRRARATSIAVPALSAVAVVLATMMTAGTSDRVVPGQPLCVAGKVQICLWPEDENYVPIVAAMSRRAATLPTLWKLPKRMDEYGLRQRAVGYGDARTIQLEGDFQIPDGSRWGLAIGLSNGIIAQTLKSCDWDAIRAADELGPEALRKWLEFYLAGSGVPGYGTSDVSPAMSAAWSQASHVFTELSAQQQREWTERQFNRVRASYCG
jgi:hypothetical protein